MPAAPSRGHVPIGGPAIAARILERQEAVSSSIIEGTHATLDALLELEEAGQGTADTQETRGVSVALTRGLDRVQREGADAFDIALICDIHKCLADEMADYKGQAGQLRDQIVWIGGTGDLSTSIWNPPPPDHVPPCLEDTLDYMRSAPEHISQFTTIVPVAVAHAHFEAVHPFADGNGRIDRLLIPLSFAAKGLTPLYLSPWIEAHKSDYYAALISAQQKLDHTQIIDVLARAVIGIEAEFNTTMRAIANLEAEWACLKMRRNSTVQRALPLLKSYPVLRAKTLADLLGVSFKSASDGLAQLVELGVMAEKTGYTRNRIFTAPRMLRILMRPFGSEVDVSYSHFLGQDLA